MGVILCKSECFGDDSMIPSGLSLARLSINCCSPSARSLLRSSLRGNTPDAEDSETHARGSVLTDPGRPTKPSMAKTFLLDVYGKNW